jgi:hypothetical protein
MAPHCVCTFLLRFQSLASNLKLAGCARCCGGGGKKPPQGVLNWVAQPKPGQDPERAELCICSGMAANNRAFIPDSAYVVSDMLTVLFYILV